MLDFDKIRQQLKAVITEHGGKIEITELSIGDCNTMKAVMTFKQPIVGREQTSDMLRNVTGFSWPPPYSDTMLTGSHGFGRCSCHPTRIG